MCREELALSPDFRKKKCSGIVWKLPGKGSVAGVGATRVVTGV
jgi:hypothetical protein